MTKEKVKYAERKAMEIFDSWNEITGIIQPCNGYYSEIRGVIEDAVHIGIQTALDIPLKYDKNGNLIHGG